MPTNCGITFDQNDGPEPAEPGKRFRGDYYNSSAPADETQYIISGTGFGTKNGTPKYVDFESESLGAVASPVSGLFMISNSGGAQVVSASHSGGKGLYNDFHTQYFPKAYFDIGDTRRGYQCGWMRLTGTLPQLGQWKFGRFSTGDDPYSGQNHISHSYTGQFGPETHASELVIDGGITEYSGTNEVTSDPSRISLGDWHFMEYEIELGDVDTANGEIRIRIDGAEEAVWTNTLIRTTANPQLLKSALSIVNGITVAVGENPVEGWFDEMYADGSRARCVLTDNATYAASTKWSIQPISTYSDTLVTATKKRGMFSIGETAYLHLFNEYGQHVHVSAPITVGED